MHSSITFLTIVSTFWNNVSFLGFKQLKEIKGTEGGGKIRKSPTEMLGFFYSNLSVMNSLYLP